MEGVFQASKACVKLVVSAGKLLRAGFRSELLPGGGFVWHPDGQRFPMYIKGNATYFEVRNVRAISAKGSDPTSPSRTMLAAPVEEQQPARRGDDQEAWEQAGQDEPEEQEPAEDLVQIGGDVNFERRGRSTLTPFSKVSQLRARLKELGKPQHGVKAELWKRVEKAEREHQKNVKEQQTRQKLLREGAAQPVPAPKAPDEPSPEERAQHELSHLPPQPWCEHCIKGRAVDTAHKQVSLELKAVNPRVEVDYSFIKVNNGTPKKKACSEDEAAEVILSAWDEATGMGTAMSLPSKNYDLGLCVPVARGLCGEHWAHQGGDSDRRRAGGEGHCKAVARHPQAGPGGGSESLESDFGDGTKVLLSIYGWGWGFPEDPQDGRADPPVRPGEPLRHPGAHYTQRLAVDGAVGRFLEKPLRHPGQRPDGVPGRLRHQLCERGPPLRRDGYVQDPNQQDRGRAGKAAAAQRSKGIFLGKSVSTNEFLFGTQDGI